MIKKGLQIALRYALKFKSYSLINVGGLALGLASSIAILHFVSEEFSYDTFHDLPDNVYRLNLVNQNGTGIQVRAAGTPTLAPLLMTDIPEVEAAVRLRHADDVMVEVGENKFFETRVFYADSNFFKVLTFPLVKGDPDSALKEVNTAVITTEFAEKYFGNNDPMGKTFEVDNILLKVTGVTSPTGNSHFKFDVLISFETFIVPSGLPRSVNLKSWSWPSFPTYVRLHEGTKAIDVEEKFPGFITKYQSAEDAKYLNYQLQPIKDVYLHSKDILERDGISTKGDYGYTVGMAAIAALILGIACFNFFNLSTALSIYRVKETGIRRTLGSSQAGIFSQFILESMLTVTISLVLALLILQIGIKNLEGVLGVGMSLSIVTLLKWLPMYIALIIFIGFIGGIYPAIFLSTLKPQLALKGKNNLGLGASKLSIRKVVIVFQFFITTSLIIASLTVNKQMNFLLTQDIGYDKEGVIAIHVPGDQMNKLFPAMTNKLSQNPIVRGTGASRQLLDGQQAVIGVSEVGKDHEEDGVNWLQVSPNFIETLGFQMIAGRTFSDQFNDSSSCVINEATVKAFGWDIKDVIGRRLNFFGKTGPIIGVVKDFNFSSLHSNIAPLLMQISNRPLELLYIRFGPGDLNQTLSSLEHDWKSVAPHLPFDYIMLDEHIDQMYRQDKRFSQLANVFCGLSVLLACLGLYGIISFMAESRTKEIGIRKILGASVLRITSLLSKEFMVWVLVASMIALPISHYMLNRWLAEFAYRIDVSIDILVTSVLSSFILAAFTVSVKLIRAARANPIESLRSE